VLLGRERGNDERDNVDVSFFDAESHSRFSVLFFHFRHETRSYRLRHQRTFSLLRLFRRNRGESSTRKEKKERLAFDGFFPNGLIIQVSTQSLPILLR